MENNYLRGTQRHKVFLDSAFSWPETLIDSVQCVGLELPACAHWELWATGCFMLPSDVRSPSPLPLCLVSSHCTQEPWPLHFSLYADFWPLVYGQKKNNTLICISLSTSEAYLFHTLIGHLYFSLWSTHSYRAKSWVIFLILIWPFFILWVLSLWCSRIWQISSPFPSSCLPHLGSHYSHRNPGIVLDVCTSPSPDSLLGAMMCGTTKDHVVSGIRTFLNMATAATIFRASIVPSVGLLQSHVYGQWSPLCLSPVVASSLAVPLPCSGKHGSPFM